jgi:hypothetical protein
MSIGAEISLNEGTLKGMVRQLDYSRFHWCLGCFRLDHETVPPAANISTATSHLQHHHRHHNLKVGTFCSHNIAMM